MANEKRRRPLRASDILHLAKTFVLELRVPDGEDFIDKYNFWIEMSGDGEGESHIHSARITFHRRVEKFLDLGKGDNLIELSPDFGTSHSQNRAVHENVFPPGQLGMKTGADFEKRAHAAIDICNARGWLSDAI